MELIPDAEEKSKPILTRDELRNQLRGSHTEFLSGVLLPQPDMTLEELRAERRAKYECLD